MGVKKVERKYDFWLSDKEEKYDFWSDFFYPDPPNTNPPN